jgi:hypothetical protein
MGLFFVLQLVPSDFLIACFACIINAFLPLVVHAWKVVFELDEEQPISVY